MQARQILARSLISSALAGLIGMAQATPIPAGILVSLGASFDAANSLNASGSASQGGQFGITSGGVSTSSNFSGISVNGGNPLNGNASQTGDGAGLSFALAGNNSGSSDGVFADLFLNFNNTGAVGYKATFAVEMLYSNLQASGADAFVKLDFSLLDAGLNEVFFSSRLRDTVNGNSDGDSASNLLEVTLNPGDSASFQGTERASGGSFAAGGSYSGNVAANLRLVSFTELGGPGPHELPLPSSLLLTLLGLGLLSTRYLTDKNSQGEHA